MREFLKKKKTLALNLYICPTKVMTRNVSHKTNFLIIKVNNFILAMLIKLPLKSKN